LLDTQRELSIRCTAITLLQAQGPTYKYITLHTSTNYCASTVKPYVDIARPIDEHIA